MSRTVRIPRLTTRSALVWLGTTVLVTLAVVGYLAVTQPQNRWAAAVVLVLLALGVAFGLSDTRTVDVEGGAIESSRLWFLRRRVALGPTTNVRLVTNRAGGLLLAAQPQGGRAVLVPVLLLSDYVERSLPADLLRTLADVVVAHEAAGGARVAADLRAQADHVAAGGSARTSPLAARVTRGALNAGKIGGAGGAAGHL